MFDEFTEDDYKAFAEEMNRPQPKSAEIALYKEIFSQLLKELNTL